MTEISSEEFRSLILSTSVRKINDYSIIDDCEISYKEIPKDKDIIDCSFKGTFKIENNILINDDEIGPALAFKNCIFENSVVFNRCKFSFLSFVSIRPAGLIFSISDSQINKFELLFSDIYSGLFSISHNTFKNDFTLSNINAHKSGFRLNNNSFSEKTDTFQRSCFISTSILTNCDISENLFGNDFRFTNNELEYNKEYSQNTFKNCVFKKASFYKSNFGGLTTFKDCIFNETVSFDELQNEIRTELEFKNCIFKSVSSFKKSKIRFIKFDLCTFENSSFFQNTYFDKIKLDSSIFEKTAFFDDIQIKDIYDCDIRTIRAIKYNLQKAENKIDYNKFRVYEFDAYKKILKRQISEYRKDRNNFTFRKREIKNFKRDLFILNITELFSDYGTDWKRALKWTLLLCLILYTIFFRLENYSDTLDLRNWKPFVIGLFRFFILTDFYNPLGEGRTYIQNESIYNVFSWLIFILGKIVIAFGIYEMIQAFRKFKA